MKNTILIVIALLFVGFAVAEPAPRQKVIVEIGTGTWCVFCPGAAMGAQDLIDNGHDVAIIKYHVSDNFANSFSTARTSYYSMPGYPTTMFDGSLQHVGGNPNSSIYATYLPLYNQSINVPSPFIIDIHMQNNTDLNHTVSVTITQVADFTASNLVLHLAVTETDIPFSWFNQTHVKDVLRLMAPNQFGTSLNFSNTDEIVVELDFNIQATWVAENMRVVAFVQDVPTKNIFQGEITTLINDEPDTYAVTFDVLDENGNPLTDAVVTLDGIENDPGDYHFDGFVPRNYNYSVSRHCSPVVNGQVSVVDEDLFVEVVMPVVAGDANSDGVVNVLDIIGTANYFAGIEVADFCFDNADVNQDGVINSLDLIMIIGIFSGK